MDDELEEQIATERASARSRERYRKTRPGRDWEGRSWVAAARRLAEELHDHDASMKLGTLECAADDVAAELLRAMLEVAAERGVGASGEGKRPVDYEPESGGPLLLSHAERWVLRAVLSRLSSEDRDVFLGECEAQGLSREEEAALDRVFGMPARST